MNRIGFLAAISSLFMLVGAQSALADDCASLGGVINAGECQVNTLGNHASGSKVLNETLHILAGASIIVDAPNLNIDITTGSFVMENGALIDGNVKNGGCPGKGSDITVTLDSGDIDLQTGSIIRSDSCTGGAVVLTTNGTGPVDIDGLVESVGSRSGDGSGLNGGGPITIVAGCSLTVSDTGVVRSRGAGPGADLVHLEGCTVAIFGLVESTAAGHVNPTKPGNKCNDGVHVAPFNLTPHSSFFTGCVEIWGGLGGVVIDSLPPHKGEVNADVGSAGGTGGRGWLDIYANGDITIVDGTGNDYTHHIGGCTYPDVFAVHSNGGLCQNTDDGGLITIKSLGGNVSAFGNAIQADATSAGSYGGEVYVEANNNIVFDGGTLTARGDNNPTGGFGIGGKLGTVATPIRAFNGTLSWSFSFIGPGEGNVLPTGTGVAAAGRGVINLMACLPSPILASFPFDGLAATTPTNTANCSGGSPTKATPGALPTCGVETSEQAGLVVIEGGGRCTGF